jgi:transcriptional regulator with XRE-family HTH domain
MRKIPADMGGRLRYLRECAGLSPERVALEIGLSARVIGDWERNYRTPRLVYLRQLAPLYRVPIATLVDAATIPEEVVAGVT